MNKLQLAAVMVVAATTLGACSTLPNNTTPQVLHPYEDHDEEEPVITPDDSRSPDQLLRDFFSASALPTGNFSAARSFLNGEAADSWNPDGRMLVLDSIDLVTTDSGTDLRVFQAHGKLVGSVSTGGAYSPESANYEAEFTMHHNDGKWRITDLPAEVVIDRTELRNQYQAQSLYFFERTGEALASDRRWLSSNRESLDSELVTLLLQGPSDTLSPGTVSMIPAGASFVGYEGGAYRFAGMTSMDSEERRKFAAQLVWTLNNAGFRGPFEVIADGAPLVEGLEEMTIDNFSEFNPRDPASTVSDLYALYDGNLLDVTTEGTEPVPGATGNIQSADVSSQGAVAAVRKLDERNSQLFMGEIGAGLEESLSARTLSRPSFELAGDAAWTVVDGSRVVRVKLSEGQRITESEVDTSALDDIDGEISVLRLSSTGARVAMIINGGVYTGVVARSQDGEYRIANVREIYPDIGDSALALDWQQDGSLIVGTASTDSPIWRIEQDGSASTAMASGNVSAPVVALEVSPSAIYLTDSQAMLELPSADTEANQSSFWREVPGVQGRRSAPIVAN